MNGSNDRDEMVRRSPKWMGIDAEGSLWIVIPQGIIIALEAFGLVYLRAVLEYGFPAPFFFVGLGIGLSAFMLVGLVAVRFSRRTDLHTAVKPKGDWLDKLGGFWLFACAGGAFFGWIALQFTVYPAVSIYMHAVTVFLTIVLPVVTMLPLIRYVHGKAMYIQTPLLTIITLLPMLVGFGSAATLVRYFVG